MLPVPRGSGLVDTTSLPLLLPQANDELGLFSKAVWDFEIHAWNAIIGGDAAEVGSGPGSYDITKSVWHVNCCNAEINGGGGWGIFNAILGWQNSATLGSVLSYNLYWVVVMVVFLSMMYKEKNGHWPLIKAKAECAHDEGAESDVNSQAGTVVDESAIEKKAEGQQLPATTTVREIS